MQSEDGSCNVARVRGIFEQGLLVGSQNDREKGGKGILSFVLLF